MKLQRNDPCLLGNGKKYKKCYLHFGFHEHMRSQKRNDTVVKARVVEQQVFAFLDDVLAVYSKKYPIMLIDAYERFFYGKNIQEEGAWALGIEYIKFLTLGSCSS